jgi:hypothetical protein
VSFVRRPGGPLRYLLLVLTLLSTASVAAQEESGSSAGASYLALCEELSAAEAALAVRILEERAVPDAAQLEELRRLEEEARLSLYGDLMDRSALLVMLAEERLAEQSLEASRPEREREFLESRELSDREAAARKRRTVAVWGSVGTTVASFAAAFTFWYLSEVQDERYFTATSVEAALRHRTYFKLFSWASYVAAGAGIVGVGVTVPVLLRSRP